MSVLAIAGTRPEIIKLVPVVLAMRDEESSAVRFCHTGQHPDLGRSLLDAAGIEPEENLDRPAGTDLSRLVAGLTTTVGAAIDRQRPHAVIVQGDTATTLAASLAAFHRQVPVAHVEAGLRSGNLSAPWPEEGYRRMISQVARWHFAPTRAAADTLRSENVDGENVHLVGNTVVDAMHWAKRKLCDDKGLGSAALPIISAAEGKRIVLVTVHRRETDRAAMKAIARGLLNLAENDDVHIVVALHPRAESEVLRDVLDMLPRITLTPALDYFSFLRLMEAARLIVTDSGGIQEEATAMGRPVLVLRETTERGEAVTVGSARIVGHDGDALVSAARWALARAMPEPSDVFGDGRAGERIARILGHELMRR